MIFFSSHCISGGTNDIEIGSRQENESGAGWALQGELQWAQIWITGLQRSINSRPGAVRRSAAASAKPSPQASAHRRQSMRPSAAAAGIIRRRSTKPSRRGSADVWSGSQDGTSYEAVRRTKKGSKRKSFRPFFNALVLTRLRILTARSPRETIALGPSTSFLRRTD